MSSTASAPRSSMLAGGDGLLWIQPSVPLQFGGEGSTRLHATKGIITTPQSDFYVKFKHYAGM